MAALKPYIQLFLPGECYDEIFEDLNFGHEECMKTFISKSLGYAITLGAIFVKLPQILKVLSARSGKGLSNLSLYLEIIAVCGTCAYGFGNSYPFSSFGDSVFLLAQNTLLMLMILLFSGSYVEAVIYTALQGTAVWYLMLSGIADPDIIWALQAANMPIIATSKMIQAYGNYMNESTGQLSFITVLMLFGGTTARIFTSIQETGDMTMVLNYVVATLCNGILLAQLLWYWNADKVDKKKKSK